jgi:hypothetical protein
MFRLVKKRQFKMSTGLIQNMVKLHYIKMKWELVENLYWVDTGKRLI